MKTYGGYLPLELRLNDEYYVTRDDADVKCMNSGKAAIYYALKAAEPECLYVPHYICPSVVEIAHKAGVEVKRYYIGNDFMPLDVNFTSNREMLLVVNYFGIIQEKVKKFALRYPQIIIDNTQAFFAEPVLRDGIYNVYSCKKFLGVPDGGYLIGKNMKDLPFEQDFSSKHMDFCLQSLEYGTDYAYEAKKENDRRFLSQVRRMSYMTHRLLQNIDYAFVKSRRVQNSQILHQGLCQYNKLNLDDISFVPYYYPLYLDKGIQKELVSSKIYVPALWRELITDEFAGKPERDFSENIVFLPCDQRYDDDDMQEIIRRVKEYL